MKRKDYLIVALVYGAMMLNPVAKIGVDAKRTESGESAPRSRAVIDRTIRCEATNVDPSTAARDMAIPSLLQRHWSRTDFGIYCKVEGPGSIAVGDAAARV